MVKLRTEPNLADPDGFYEALVRAQEDLSPEAAQRMTARLILLLANHIGDDEALREAIDRARRGTGSGAPL